MLVTKNVWKALCYRAPARVYWNIQNDHVFPSMDAFFFPSSSDCEGVVQGAQDISCGSGQTNPMASVGDVRVWETSCSGLTLLSSTEDLGWKRMQIWIEINVVKSLKHTFQKLNLAAEHGCSAANHFSVLVSQWFCCSTYIYFYQLQWIICVLSWEILLENKKDRRKLLQIVFTIAFYGALLYSAVCLSSPFG